MDRYEYYREIFEGVPKPFAFLDLDLLNENIRAIRQRTAGKRIRIASKSIRSVGVLKRIFACGPEFQGIMAYTAAEALYLSRQGFDDILLGYPIYQPEYITEIGRLVGDGRSIVLMVDSADHVAHIERIAADFGARLPVCLDIDMSYTFLGFHFGVWRSPLRTATQVDSVVRRILESKYVYLDGVMGYEAQIAGVGDNMPGQAVKNAVVRFLQHRSVPDVAARRAEIVDRIQAMGVPLRFVNGGGTGSLQSTAQEDAVTEVTVGSGFYSPGLFDNYRAFQYKPAIGFAVEIVRTPRPGVFTCAGGGYVASGAAGADKLPKPYLPPGAQLVPLEGAGEVQTPVRYAGATPLSIGHPVFMRHSKAGELCERFHRLYCVSAGEIVDEVKTYRGDGECFL